MSKDNFEIIGFDLTEKEIDKAWGNANFGEGVSKIDVIKFGLLSCVGQYAQSHTLKTILQELNLISKTRYDLTARGRKNMYELFRKGLNY